MKHLVPLHLRKLKARMVILGLPLHALAKRLKLTSPYLSLALSGRIISPEQVSRAEAAISAQETEQGVKSETAPHIENGSIKKEESGTYASRISALAELLGSHRRLARWFKVTPPTIQRWIEGQEPHPGTLFAAASATGLSIEWLQSGGGNEQANLNHAKAYARNNAVPGINALSSLREAMDTQGLSVADLAKLTGYNPEVVCAVVEGRARASERFIDALCKSMPTLDKSALMSGCDSSFAPGAGRVLSTLTNFQK
jgi:transcriptional regulator with XRE-family HTH domain